MDAIVIFVIVIVGIFASVLAFEVYYTIRNRQNGLLD